MSLGLLLLQGLSPVGGHNELEIFYLKYFSRLNHPRALEYFFQSITTNISEVWQAKENF